MKKIILSILYSYLQIFINYILKISKYIVVLFFFLGFYNVNATETLLFDNYSYSHSYHLKNWKTVFIPYSVSFPTSNSQTQPAWSSLWFLDTSSWSSFSIVSPKNFYNSITSSVSCAATNWNNVSSEYSFSSFDSSYIVHVNISYTTWTWKPYCMLVYYINWETGEYWEFTSSALELWFTDLTNLNLVLQKNVWSWNWAFVPAFSKAWLKPFLFWQDSVEFWSNFKMLTWSVAETYVWELNVYASSSSIVNHNFQFIIDNNKLRTCSWNANTYSVFSWNDNATLFTYDSLSIPSWNNIYSYGTNCSLLYSPSDGFTLFNSYNWSILSYPTFYSFNSWFQSYLQWTYWSYLDSDWVFQMLDLTKLNNVQDFSYFPLYIINTYRIKTPSVSRYKTTSGSGYTIYRKSWAYNNAYSTESIVPVVLSWSGDLNLDNPSNTSVNVTVNPSVTVNNSLNDSDKSFWNDLFGSWSFGWGGVSGDWWVSTWSNISIWLTWSVTVSWSSNIQTFNQSFSYNTWTLTCDMFNVNDSFIFNWYFVLPSFSSNFDFMDDFAFPFNYIVKPLKFVLVTVVNYFQYFLNNILTVFYSWFYIFPEWSHVCYLWHVYTVKYQSIIPDPDNVLYVKWLEGYWISKWDMTFIDYFVILIFWSIHLWFLFFFFKPKH